MIRINLLPAEDRAKKTELHLPEMSTVYLVAAIVIFVASIGVASTVQRHRVRSL